MSDLMTILKLGADVKLTKEQAQHLADLIEQQRQRITELEAKTSCCMGVGNGNGRLFVYGDYESIKAAQRYILERNELAATVERLRDYIERGAPYSTNPSKCERKAILEATPRQNLNDIKRDVAESAIKTALRNLGEGSLSEQDISSFAQQYADTTYPSGEE